MVIKLKEKVKTFAKCHNLYAESKFYKNSHTFKKKRNNCTKIVIKLKD